MLEKEFKKFKLKIIWSKKILHIQEFNHKQVKNNNNNNMINNKLFNNKSNNLNKVADKRRKNELTKDICV